MNAAAEHITPGTCRGSAQRVITRLRTRLARWERTHLRAHAADLAERLEEAERRAWNAEDRADMWEHMARQLQKAQPEISIGLTQAGQLVCISEGGAA